MSLYNYHLYKVKGPARSIFLVVVFVVSSFGSAFSQGEYLEKGQDGSGFGGGYAYTKPANVAAIGGTVGCSIKGILDLATSFSRLNFNTNGVDGFSFSPHATFHIKADSNRFPFFGSVTAGYESESGLAMSSFLTLGASVSWNIRPSSIVYFQPSFGLSYIAGTTKVGDYSQHSESMVRLVGLSIVFITSSRNSLVIGPSLGWYKDQKAYSMTVAFVLKR